MTEQERLGKVEGWETYSGSRDTAEVRVAVPCCGARAGGDRQRVVIRADGVTTCDACGRQWAVGIIVRYRDAEGRIGLATKGGKS